MSGGTGNVTDECCSSLNGTFLLTYSPCDSTGRYLVWNATCQPPDANVNCGMYQPPHCRDLAYLLDVPSFGSESCSSRYEGQFTLRGSGCAGPFPNPTPTDCVDYSADFNYHLYRGCQLRSLETTAINDLTGLCNSGKGDLVDNCNRIAGRVTPMWLVSYSLFRQIRTNYDCYGLITEGDAGVFLYAVDVAIDIDLSWVPVSAPYCAYFLDNGQQLGDSTLTFRKFFDISFEENTCTSSLPDSLSMSLLTDYSTGGTGPEPTDWQRGQWRLRYDTQDGKWEVLSYDRVKFPRYVLLDSNPCDLADKTLTLDESSDTENGCESYPSTVTITPLCPEDRGARARRRDGRTDKYRPCGCDCQDEVDDLRYDYGLSKCISTSTPGCESYSADQVECMYPLGSDCCTTCIDEDPPCAYVADFGCDVTYEGISIAAANVVLRHACYFENQCSWVAIGPITDIGLEHTGAGTGTGTTGGVGVAQPVGESPIYASCGDGCQSCCTWSTWRVSNPLGT